MLQLCNIVQAKADNLSETLFLFCFGLHSVHLELPLALHHFYEHYDQNNNNICKMNASLKIFKEAVFLHVSSLHKHPT